MSLEHGVTARKQKLIGLLQGMNLPRQARAGLANLGYDLGRAAVAAPTAHVPIGEVGSERVLERWVQAALTVVLGVRLPLTGQLGDLTRKALLQFQKASGLATHGQIDDATLRALEAAVGLPAPRTGTFASRRPVWQDARLTGTTLRGLRQTEEGKPAAVHSADAERETARRMQRASALAACSVALQRPWLEEVSARVGRSPTELQRDAHNWAESAAQAADPSLWQPIRTALERSPTAGAEALQAALLAHWRVQPDDARALLQAAAEATAPTPSPTSTARGNIRARSASPKEES